MDKKKLAINAFPSVDDEIDNFLPVMSRKLVKKLAIKIKEGESREQEFEKINQTIL